MFKSGLTLLFVALFSFAQGQNVFNPNDPIVRYDGTKPLGSAQKPDPSVSGLQKWVSTPTSGVSVGTSSIDVSSFKQYFINVAGTPMAFRIKYPKSFSNADSSAKKYPVMLFLHGAGEVGCPTNGGVYNNEKQLWLGGGLFRDFVDQNLFDGFLVYPQLVNADGCWGAWGSAPTANFTAVLAMIDSMAQYVRADLDRVVVNGLSGGGYGAWRIADIAPQRIARIIPSAAASTSVNRTNIVHIPVWFATGAKDPDPNTTQADNTLKRLKDIGANIRYTRYEDLGHAVWYRHWREPDYAAVMNEAHKANPLVYFQHNEFCESETINPRLGVTPGFYAYEWQRNGVTIATRTNGVNTITLPEHVTTFTGNEIVVKTFGTYRVRFRRTATAAWSEFSPRPVEVKLKTITLTPDIAVAGAYSFVLPSPDGRTTVPLQLPEGYLTYEWYRASDNSPVSSSRVFDAPVGTYRARVTEQFGCGSEFSSDFKVIDANGSPKPDVPTKLIAVPASQNSIALSWTQGANETGFEVFRSKKAGGPYQFAALTAANASSYTDASLEPNTSYYYVVRSINTTGASDRSNEASGKTLSDKILPVAPANLQYQGSTSTTVRLSWSPGSDNNGIRRYDIYADGVKMYSTTQTTFDVHNLDSLRSYSFYVKSVDISDNESAPSNQITAYTHRQGLSYKYFTTTASWYTLPNLKALNPVKTGITDSVNISDASIDTRTERFAYLWEGFIYIPVTSTYTFETRSDDGSKLYIDVPYSYSAAAVVNNDTIHGMRSRTGTITLTQGYHSIAIAYFQRVYGMGLELYWKNSSGLARQLIPKNFFSHNGSPSAQSPSVPQGVNASALSYNEISIKWTDNNSIETGYEIVRSTSSGGTYVPVGTTAPNAVSFIDSGLAWSKTYYYKVRAIGESAESPYSGAVSATTQAKPAYVPAPSPLTALPGPDNSIILNWQDNAINEWNYRVYRSTNGTSFSVIFASKANVNAYTDLNAQPQTVYYYYVLGYNGSGLGPKTNIVKIKAGNNAPSFGDISHIAVRTGETAERIFQVSDENGDVVAVEVVDKPAFVQIEKTGASDFRLSARPTNDNVGQYTIVLRATDNNAGSSDKTVVVTVTDSKSRAVFVNFGASGKAAKLPWNNWLGTRSAGDVINGLNDENDNPTPFSITTVNGWSGTTLLGHLTGNNSGIAPDSVLESGIADNGPARQLKIGGLDPSKKYNIKLIGSQNEGLSAVAIYTSGAQSTSLDARYNTHQSANLNGITPDPAGDILVNVTRAAGSAFTYLNGLVIEELNSSITLYNPEHLHAEVVNEKLVNLTWNDRASNEGATEGFELQRAGDSLFTQGVTLVSLSENTLSYTDENVSPGQTYWYRVRARNGSSFSEFSNRFKAVTPSAVVYINFNSTLPDQAFPWNNTAASPLSEFIIENLIDQKGKVTTMNLSLTQVFNGEFTAGANTGNNSGVVPDNVLASNFWLDNTQLSQLKLSGLNHTKKYRIGFVGSSSTPGWFKGNYTATYTVNGRTVYLNSWMNSSKAVYISNIDPDANGEVYMDFSTTQAAQWAFNAGIIVQEYTDAAGSSLYTSNSTLDSTDTEIALVDDQFKARLYPNPFRDQLNIDFINTAQSNKIAAEVHDLAGRLVFRQQYNEMPAGRNTIRILKIPGAVKGGVYLLSLKVNGKVAAVRKMIREE